MRPTWRNKRVRDDRISMRLDIFLLYEGLIHDQYRVRQWVGNGGDSNHFSFFMEMVVIQIISHFLWKWPR
jgi:hypothetical protein